MPRYRFTYWNARHFALNIFKNKIHNQSWIPTRDNNGSTFSHFNLHIQSDFQCCFFYTAKTVEECVATHGSTLLSIFKYQKNLPLPTRQVYEQQWSTSGTRNRLHLSSLQLDSGFLQGFQHKHFLLLEEIFVAPTTWEQPDWASLYETAEAITYRDQTVIHYWNKYCKWTW